VVPITTKIKSVSLVTHRTAPKHFIKFVNNFLSYFADRQTDRWRNAV